MMLSLVKIWGDIENATRHGSGLEKKAPLERAESSPTKPAETIKSAMDIPK